MVPAKHWPIIMVSTTEWVNKACCVLRVPSTQLCPSWRTRWCCSTPSPCSASSTSSPSLWAGTSHRVSARFTSTGSSRTSSAPEIGHSLAPGRHYNRLARHLLPASVSRHVVDSQQTGTLGWLTLCWVGCLSLDFMFKPSERWHVWTSCTCRETDDTAFIIVLFCMICK